MNVQRNTFLPRHNVNFHFPDHLKLQILFSFCIAIEKPCALPSPQPCSFCELAILLAKQQYFLHHLLQVRRNPGVAYFINKITMHSSTLSLICQEIQPQLQKIRLCTVWHYDIPLLNLIQGWKLKFSKPNKVFGSLDMNCQCPDTT